MYLDLLGFEDDKANTVMIWIIDKYQNTADERIGKFQQIRTGKRVQCAQSDFNHFVPDSVSVEVCRERKHGAKDEKTFRIDRQTMVGDQSIHTENWPRLSAY